MKWNSWRHRHRYLWKPALRLLSRFAEYSCKRFYCGCNSQIWSVCCAFLSLVIISCTTLKYLIIQHCVLQSFPGCGFCHCPVSWSCRVEYQSSKLRQVSLMQLSQCLTQPEVRLRTCRENCSFIMAGFGWIMLTLQYLVPYCIWSLYSCSLTS